MIFQEVAIYIKEENKSLTEDLLTQAINQLNIHLTDEQVGKHRGLLEALLENVAEGLLNNEHEIKTMELEYDIDNFFYHDGALLKDTIEIISTFRLSLLHEIQRRGLMESSNVQNLSRLYNQVIYIFDDAIRNTTKKFNLENLKVLDTIELEIMALAAPIVPIKNGLAVLPLSGNFSESRTTYISSQVIPKIVDMNIEMLIIDFSGIHNFDTHIAQQIFQLRDVLQLLDIQPVITGISPAIAQTAVNLGIEIKDLRAYGTVQQFLEKLQ